MNLLNDKIRLNNNLIEKWEKRLDIIFNINEVLSILISLLLFLYFAFFSPSLVVIFIFIFILFFSNIFYLMYVKIVNKTLKRLKKEVGDDIDRVLKSIKPKE